MCNFLSYMNGGFMNLISGIYHLYEREKYTFMIFREYIIIFQIKESPLPKKHYHNHLMLMEEK